MAAKKKIYREKKRPHRRAPFPMTTREFRIWKKSPEGEKERERLIESEYGGSLPTFLRLTSAFGDLYEPQEVRTQVRADEKKKKAGKAHLGECQTKEISPAIAKQLKGFERVALFPPTPKGKSQARAKKKQLQKLGGEEGREIAVRVRKLYCHDTNPPANHWTVWVRQPKGIEKDGEIQIRSGQTRKGIEERSELVPTWTSYRPAARMFEVCPVCDAPKKAACRSGWKYPEGWAEGDEVGGAYTNPHKPRVNLLIEEYGEEEALKKSIKARREY